jgi:hypothetical protein
MANDDAHEKPLGLERQFDVFMTRLAVAEACCQHWSEKASTWHRRYRSVSTALFAAAVLAGLEFVILLALAMRAAGLD